jgi:hypothetical protein
MSTDLSEIGILKRQFRDVHSVVSRLDNQTRRIFEPQPLRRPAGLVARLAACTVLARLERRQPPDVAKQAFSDDRELGQLVAMKTAVSSAQTGVAGWASELAADDL